MSDNLTPDNVSHNIPQVLKHKTGARGMLRMGLPGVDASTEGGRGSYRALWLHYSAGGMLVPSGPLPPTFRDWVTPAVR